MYDLSAFHSRVNELYRRANPYGDGHRPTQQDLAEAVGLNRSELSSRLNGLKNARLTSRDVKAIVLTLAEWGAITTQAEALELLALVDCPNFTAAEWQSSPLADLVATVAPPATPTPAPAPPAANLKPQTSSLPHPLTSFVGRERELAEVVKLTTQRRLVTLTGVGGCGKTRLAIEVAERMWLRFKGKVYFAELASLSDAAMITTSLCRVLGVEERVGQSLTEALHHLQSVETLLVLDNCEHLSAPLAELAHELLAAYPYLHILATSREVLHVAGETIYHVPPLAVPGKEIRITVESMARYDAVQLFVARAQSINTDFQLATENIAAVHAICQQLDGIPLAIELAAARLRAMSPTQIIAQLSDRFRLLTDRARGVQPRHQTLRAMIDWSYNLLPAGEQTLFRQLSAFSGGFTVSAVAYLLDASPIDALDQLTELLNKSLITLSSTSAPADESTGSEVNAIRPYSAAPAAVKGSWSESDEPRFTMLETIREYARLKLDDSGEYAAVQRRHAEYYVAFAEEAKAQWQGAQQQWFALLEQEHDNLRAAMRWALENDHDIALRFVIALFRFWYNRGYAVEGLSFSEATLAVADMEDTWRRMKAMSNAAGLAAELGKLERAATLYQQSLQLSRHLNDHKAIATTLSNLGTLAMEHGNYDQAGDYYKQTLAMGREIGDETMIAHSLHNLSLVEMHRCRYAEANALALECLNLERQLGDQHDLSIIFNILAGIAMYSGDYPAASRYVTEALDIAREIGDRRNMAVALNTLAVIAYLTGDYARSAQLHRDTLTLRRDIGYRVGVTESLEGVALLATQFDLVAAARLWGAAQRLRQEIGAPTIPPDWAIFAPQIEQLRQRLGEAAFEQALREGEAFSFDDAVAFALVQTEAIPPELVQA